VINLPSFKDSNKFLRTIIGDWEYTAIVQITSGTSFTPNIAAGGLSYYEPAPNPANGNMPFGVRGFPAGFTGTGTAVANQRPLFVGPCPASGDPENIITSSAYTLAGMRVGELSPSDSKGRCLGPGIHNVDMSIYKNFSGRWLKESFFGEDARIQFRLEMYNAFNTPQFRGDSMGTNYYGGQVVCGGDPITHPCSPTNNVITGITGSSPSNFGKAGATRGGREIQYALKLVF
jgi:hypothetical protein